MQKMARPKGASAMGVIMCGPPYGGWDGGIIPTGLAGASPLGYKYSAPPAVRG